MIARSLPDWADPRASFFLQIFRFPKKSGMGFGDPVPESGNDLQIARLCQILVKGLSVPEYV